jgi:hypothetical protein
MADFLTNLAARALGQTNSIRPRQERRFEPANNVYEEVHVINVERVRRPPAQPATRRENDFQSWDKMADATDPADQPELEQPSTPMNPVQQPAARPGTDTLPPDRTQTIETNYEEPISQAELPDMAHHRAPDHLTPESVFRTPETRTVPHKDDRSIQAERIDSKPPEPVTHEPRGERPSVQPIAGEHPEHDEESADRDTPTETHALQVRTKVVRESQHEREGRGTVETSEKPPKISVTIGRVEVKSSPTPEPQRPEPRPRPRPLVSLNEYLTRSRKSGR